MNNPYETSGLFRGAIDAAGNENGNPLLPRGEIMHQPGIHKVGEEHGAVQILATGRQTLEIFHEPIGMILFASPNSENPLHHYAFLHEGKPDNNRDMVIGVIHECPGMYFNLDCGCSKKRDHVVEATFGNHPDAACLISFDPETPTNEKTQTLQGIFDSLRIRELKHLRKDMGKECDLQRRLQSERTIHQVFFSCDGRVFVKTHDMKVQFADNKSESREDARLVVYEEQPRDLKHGYSQKKKIHYVLVYGDIHNPEKPPIARYHSSCKTAEHGGNACDCRIQREATLRLIREHGSGVLIYADEEGMGLGAVAKFWQTHITIGKAGNIYQARDMLDMPWDVRTYSLIEIIRRDLKIQSIILASNNREKASAFDQHGIEVRGIVPLTTNSLRLAPQAIHDIQAKIASGRYNKYYTETS
ncbi:MAG: hypothetical protein N3A54_04955 [Patescibacteria group bacterium]|nr:hypothetical protein [Patescibacteria group bacterium]